MNDEERSSVLVSPSLPRDAVARCPSVHLSVALRYCVSTAKAVVIFADFVEKAYGQK